MRVTLTVIVTVTLTLTVAVAGRFWATDNSSVHIYPSFSGVVASNRRHRLTVKGCRGLHTAVLELCHNWRTDILEARR